MRLIELTNNYLCENDVNLLTMLTSLILIFSTVGTTLFLVLMMFESSVFRLIFYPNDVRIKDSDIRFVFESLQRVVHLLPPLNGIITMSNIILLSFQGYEQAWSLKAILIPSLYAVLILYIIFSRNMTRVVKNIKNISYEDDISKIKNALRKTIIPHHLAFLTNFLVLALEFTFYVI